jgi:hypothetical protein
MKNVIYKISNNVNDKIYIGSAVCFKKRYAQHKHHLLKNTHHNILLQNHVNKYGFDSIKFEVLENVLGNDLIIREQFYIDNLNPFFNIRRIAESMKGTKRTTEQKARMSERSKEFIKTNVNFKSEETRQKAVKTRKEKGWPVSEETKRKISESCKGRTVSEYQISQIKLKNTGTKRSDKTKQMLSIAKKGPLNPMFGKNGSEHHNFGKRWIAKTTKTPKRIIDTNTGTVYPSIKDASVFLGIPRSTLNKYVLGYNEKITNFKYHD